MRGKEEGGEEYGKTVREEEEGGWCEGGSDNGEEGSENKCGRREARKEGVKERRHGEKDNVGEKDLGRGEERKKKKSQ